jgi:hypothetical protein
MRTLARPTAAICLHGNSAFITPCQARFWTDRINWPAPAYKRFLTREFLRNVGSGCPVENATDDPAPPAHDGRCDGAACVRQTEISPPSSLLASQMSFHFIVASGRCRPDLAYSAG